jgi:cytochrome c biogenesis protein CcmG/thiol:disulfide interchange protein DsbE
MDFIAGGLNVMDAGGIMRKVIRIALVIVIISIMLLVAGCSGDEENGGIPAPGKKAPDFQLKTLDGETVSLESLRGRPVLINFWATWCVPCRAEVPILQQLHESSEWRTRGLAILAVNLGEQNALVQDFIEAFNLSFMILIDSDQRVAMRYNAAYIPTTYFVDKDGIIRDIKVGAIFSIAEIEPMLRNLLKSDKG